MSDLVKDYTTEYVAGEVGSSGVIASTGTPGYWTTVGTPDYSWQQAPQGPQVYDVPGIDAGGRDVQVATSQYLLAFSAAVGSIRKVVNGVTYDYASLLQAGIAGDLVADNSAGMLLWEFLMANIVSPWSAAWTLPSPVAASLRISALSDRLKIGAPITRVNGRDVIVWWAFNRGNPFVGTTRDGLTQYVGLPAGGPQVMWQSQIRNLTYYGT
ncbi:MAG: hypothetical protein WC107_07685 [Patescibacteria group bacterium]